MKTPFLMVATTAAAIVGVGMRAAELPGFELAGFRITPHQVAVMGAANIREQSPVPTLTFRGMPASPSQIAILTPRPGMIAEAADVEHIVDLASK
jgi:hypothetical protein